MKTLIASGEYQYFCNDELQSIEEPWSVHQDGDSFFISSKRIAHDYGVEIETKAISLNGICNLTEADVSWDAGGKISVNITADDGAALFPLMRIYMGNVVSYLLKQNGEGSVIIPNIKDINNPEKLLKSEKTNRKAELIGQTSIDGVIVNEYKYTGDQYGDDTRLWIDEHGVLIQYKWPQSEDQNWLVKVSEYIRP